MRRAGRWLMAGVVVAGLGISGCGSSHESAAAPAFTVTTVKGTSLKRLSLTPQAIARVGLQTATATAAPGGRGAVVPYSALIYAPDGVPSVFTSPAPRVYIRHAIVIDRIAGNTVYVKTGVTPGTSVVTVGAVELLGAETGVEE
jgi:hypothetical protein